MDHVLQFIGTAAYQARKKKRFPNADYDIPVNQNPAFLLDDENIRADFTKRYRATATLYYRGQPDFETILASIRQYLDKL